MGWCGDGGRGGGGGRTIAVSISTASVTHALCPTLLSVTIKAMAEGWVWLIGCTGSPGDSGIPLIPARPRYPQSTVDGVTQGYRHDRTPTPVPWTSKMAATWIITPSTSSQRQPNTRERITNVQFCSSKHGTLTNVGLMVGQRHRR